jgi:hypothetical protein
MPTLSKTIILFFDVERYPPSLQYLLVTLGVIFVLHLYVIHLATILLGDVTHQPVRWLFHGGFFLSDPPDGEPYEHGLGVVCGRGCSAVLSVCTVCAGEEESSGLIVAIL